MTQNNLNKSKNELKKIQTQTIADFFAHQLPFSPYYRQYFADNKLNFNKIKTVEDLKNIPFSSKANLLPSPNAPESAKDFILQPDINLIKKYAPKSKIIKLAVQKMLGVDVMKDLLHEYNPIHIHFTTGRSTAPIPYFYTAKDIETFQETGRRLFEMLGIDKKDIVINAFPFAPHLAFWQAYHAIYANDLFALHTGGGKIMGTQKIIDATEKMKATVMAAIPGYGYHVLKEAAKQGRDFSNLRLMIFGGEAVTDGFRQKCREVLEQVGAGKAKILSTYALTESKTAWGQCCEESGYHLYPDMEYIELVDENGQRVKDGEKGEIVITTLGWRGSAVVRYKTGDVSYGLKWEKCKYCGRELPTLDKQIDRVVGNVEVQLTKVKGELLSPSAIGCEINAIPEIDEWQLEIKKHNDDPYDLDEMVLHISLKDSKNADRMTNKIKKKIRQTAFISPVIEVHTHEEMVDMVGLETELKDKRFVDRRKK